MTIGTMLPDDTSIISFYTDPAYTYVGNSTFKVAVSDNVWKVKIAFYVPKYLTWYAAYDSKTVKNCIDIV